jgi:AraC family transcriptional activator of tynA and feaB
MIQRMQRVDVFASTFLIGSNRSLLRSAAIRLAEEHLQEEDLSPTSIARGLNVSVRTLYRAFNGTEETLMGYVRRRRLEQARDDLISGNGTLTVCEIGQRWCFADSSHFIRAFRQRFGTTPARIFDSLLGVE